jgi:hypothetical protein
MLGLQCRGRHREFLESVEVPVVGATGTEAMLGALVVGAPVTI